MRVTIIGANGFVGTGLGRYLATQPVVEINPVTRQNYDSHKGASSDITIDTSGNSKKFLSDQEPLKCLDLTVAQRLRTLRDFPADLHVHISSVDVYPDLGSPATTREDLPIALPTNSNYGLHKLLAEQIVQHYAKRWLILRLAGMVGPALRKNPVFDLLHGQPLRIHPESQYQYMHTLEVARIVWALVSAGREREVFNVCGDGLISPNRIAALAGKTPDLSQLSPAATPRIVNASIEKLKTFTTVETTESAVMRFVKEFESGSS